MECVAKECMVLFGCTVCIAKSVDVTRVLSTKSVQLVMRSCKACSPHWGLNPGPSVYKTDALPLSYRGS